MKTNSYRDLIVWQKSMELTVLIYRLTAAFPKDEIYGLTSQMRRAAVSIPSNIAEGYKRAHCGEYLQFLSISDGSAAELDTQLAIADALNYGSGVLKQDINNLLTEVQKMLFSMIRIMKTNKTSG